jgi:hypothetical protein
MILYQIEADFSSPNAQSATWVTVYDPEHMDPDGDCAYGIDLEMQLGAAGSLSFTIPRTHSEFGSFVVLGTTVRVTADSAVIWFGRVLSIKTDFYRNRTIICEGALAYLNDILIRPFRYFHEEADGGAWTGKTVHVDDPQPGYVLLADVIDKYNLYASGKRKAFLSGYDSDLPCMGDDMLYTGVDDYTSAMSVISNILSNDSTAVINWSAGNSGLVLEIVDIKNGSFPSGGGSIVLAQNLTDYALSLDGADIYTQLIPLDKDKNKVDAAYGDESIPSDCVYGTSPTRNIYGNIERVYSYAAEATSGELYDIGTAVMDAANAANGSEPAVIEVGAVDMALVEGGGMIKVGATYTITSEFHGLSSAYLCTGLKVRLDEPGAASYTFIRQSSGIGKNDGRLTDMIGSYGGRSDSITDSAVYDDDEAPERLVQIDEYHVAAVMNGRVENYVLDNFATDDVTETEGQEHYELKMYETDIPADLPPKPVPNNQEGQNGQT